MRAGPLLVLSGGLGVLAVVLFIAAAIVSGNVPPGGDAQLEALASTLTASAGTAATVSVTLASVLFALRLEDRRRTRREWNAYQTELLQEAYELIDGLSSAFFEVYGLLEEAANAVGEVTADEKRTLATARAQRIRDDLDLERLSVLAELIESENVAGELERMDGELRQWNEQVAGDHAAPEVHLEDDVAVLFLEYGSQFSDRARSVRDEYLRALRSQFGVVS